MSSPFRHEPKNRALCLHWTNLITSCSIHFERTLPYAVVRYIVTTAQNHQETSLHYQKLQINSSLYSFRSGTETTWNRATFLHDSENSPSTLLTLNTPSLCHPTAYRDRRNCQARHRTRHTDRSLQARLLHQLMLRRTAVIEEHCLNSPVHTDTDLFSRTWANQTTDQKLDTIFATTRPMQLQPNIIAGRYRLDLSLYNVQRHKYSRVKLPVTNNSHLDNL